MKITKRRQSNNRAPNYVPAKKGSHEAQSFHRVPKEEFSPLKQVPRLFPSPPPFDATSRKYFDVKRWQCISRPQFPCSCGITTVVACWNYLFSILGNGKLPYITAPEALKALGFQQDIKRIPFFDIAINQNIMRWFRRLCEVYKVKGDVRTYWRNSMTDVNPRNVLKNYMNDIRNPNKAFIYHCYKHYLTPIGYEMMPKDENDVYTEFASLEDSEPWLIIGESSKGHPGLHVVKWEDIERDLMCDCRFIYNIRQQFRGFLRNNDKINYHRLILFEKLED